jgi:hypothetical protein
MRKMSKRTFSQIFLKNLQIFVKLIQLDLDPDLATQVNADPDPKP